ncbi:MAG: hypothetical protein AOY29_05390 [Alcanivorax borkumensis]|jgi:uncharacterized protein|uniref:Uncharacterized protein n=1 Tax=Alcanivorax borkumensis (strain ATCC 700651 / DSM 11573 / NCIMB 13689 / SK2) TaxID=393595 RepID=Q0VSC7_ALCBS|nr:MULTISPECIES: PP0621 family protein [Alcanivorax]OJH06879.1 MAG: hypothetical protein AOY29_05390 [Alcanivorax borkumensis]EUC68119.1 hypothetical protein Y017_06010 [Alcanivorax sp. 97CO-5]PKG00491.1 hypothetical protein Y019_13285 [Alcanivorax sp. 97CO-6]CAL15921.1 conserved hypothetical protein [Alcanivorax borkumensis SK2]BAP13339.1 hypothetical protein AS19_04880 [Alcanivorax sp. NBRC 101098]
MGLIRLIIIAALIYLAWRVMKQLLAQARPTAPDNSTSNPQIMVKCAQCGVHVPAPDAFSHGGLHFCSQEHQRQYLEQHDR